MVKYTETIHRQHPTYCLSVYDHFVGLVFKWLRVIKVRMQKFLHQKLGHSLYGSLQECYDWLEKWIFLVWFSPGILWIATAIWKNCGPQQALWFAAGKIMVLCRNLLKVMVCQGLIQKEKVHIDYEKGTQISILGNKIAT